jgi:hypothetical protein
MKKRKIRCYLAYCDAGGIFNNEVVYTASEGYRIELATCIKCGAILVLDRENPQTAEQSLESLVDGATCPECGCDLSESIRLYPETFRGKGGHLGSFTPPKIIPPDSESRVIEVWEIIPSGPR